MTRFSYQARDVNGRPLTGHVEAANAGVVAAQLSEIGAIPLTIAPADAETSSTLVLPWFKEKVKIDELIIFSHQMATLAKAGISVVRAVRGLSESARNPRLAGVLEEVAADVNLRHTSAGFLGQRRRKGLRCFRSLRRIVRHRLLQLAPLGVHVREEIFPE